MAEAVALVTLGVGVVLLVILVVSTLRPVRRLRRAAEAMREALHERATSLRALRNATNRVDDARGTGR
jgi:Na+-transporting methylmalonyl-CoA/oxaloacetate decarboxylase gamma subunit